MHDVSRWLVSAMAIALVVCLLVWARGEDHHRGDDVGSLGIADSVPPAPGWRPPTRSPRRLAARGDADLPIETRSE
jgi:hypothetical protein